MSADERTLGERVEAWIAAYSNASHKVQHSMQIHDAADLIGEQQAEIERLGKELADTASWRDAWYASAGHANAECDSLRRDLEAARVDAERWRTFRSKTQDGGWELRYRKSGRGKHRWSFAPVAQSVEYELHTTADAAIDLARARGEGNADE